EAGCRVHHELDLSSTGDLVLGLAQLILVCDPQLVAQDIGAGDQIVLPGLHRRHRAAISAAVCSPFATATHAATPQRVGGRSTAWLAMVASTARRCPEVSPSRRSLCWWVLMRSPSSSRWRWWWRPVEVAGSRPGP